MTATVVVIGVFDGVHLGHQALIAAAQAATGTATEVIAVTFDPHPAQVLAPERAPALLLPLADRCAELGNAGASRTVVVPFTSELAQWAAERFIDEIVLPLNPTVVCVGSNFRFGRGASADVVQLAEFGATRGFEVLSVPLTGTAQSWSSTQVRGLIELGDVAAASRILGRPHRLSGPVVHGDARGRELGFPTANVDVDEQFCIPADGVYAGTITIPGLDVQLCAAVSVGTNPQFAGDARRIEAYALDAPSRFDIYGEPVRVEFLERIRGQKVYASLSELTKAIGTDVGRVRQICGELASMR